jgi:hypothetical protein
MNSPFAPAAQNASLAEVKASMEQANPSIEPPRAPARRIPLGLPTLKLETPEIPGYFSHWFRNNPGRVQQALAAGYQFVERGEVELNGYGLAGDYNTDGNSDLGSRVTRAAEAGEGLILMKIRKELALEDKEAYIAQQEALASQIRGDQGLPSPVGDSRHRYSKGDKSQSNFLIPRDRRT